MTREDEIEGALPSATGRWEKRTLLRFGSGVKENQRIVNLPCESIRSNQSIVTCRGSALMTNERFFLPQKDHHDSLMHRISNTTS